MAAQTGRTVSRWVAFKVDDGAGTLRTIPVDSINGVGLTYPEEELSAFLDAVKGALPNTPDCQIAIGGPFDNLASTGSHTVLAGIVGGSTPLSLDVQVGIRHAWESGEPQFGLTGTTTDGFVCTEYTVDMASMKYSAKFRVIAGSAAPVWATTAET